MQIIFAIPNNIGKIAKLLQYCDENGISIEIEGHSAIADVPETDLQAFQDWIFDNEFEEWFETEITENKWEVVHFTVNDNLKLIQDFAEKHNTRVLFSIHLPKKSIIEFNKFLKENNGEIIK
jgi:hypothetical protein